MARLDVKDRQDIRDEVFATELKTFYGGYMPYSFIRMPIRQRSSNLALFYMGRSIIVCLQLGVVSHPCRSTFKLDSGKYEGA